MSRLLVGIGCTAIVFGLLQCYLDGNRSNSTSDFLKADSGASSNESQADEVDGLGWLQEDICPEFIIINNIGGVVSLVTNDEEVIQSSFRLYVAKIRFHNVDKVETW